MWIFHKCADIKKLFTKQDTFSIHKILGAFSISSFIYRYLFVYNQEGNLGLENNLSSWVTMGLHTMLSCSSIIFHVPKKRIPDKPMIIYEEYRRHAMVFTLRCFSVFSMAVLYPERPWYILPLVVASHHLLADYITKINGTEGNTAVRSTSRIVKDDSIYKKYISKFYSFYQFLAIASHITNHEETPDLAYNAIIAIQTSAFAMTLYRKKIIKGLGHLAIYGSCLILSTYHILRILTFYELFLTSMVFYTRISLENKLNNKYILWTVFLFLLNK